MMRFQDKVVLITGAASGLGRATALQLAQEGAKLAIVDRNGAALEETQGALRAAAPNVEILAIAADVADEQAVRGFVDQTVARFGAIDGFFNNAGIEGKQNPTEDYGIDEFHKVVAVNLDGVFVGMKYVLQAMHRQGYGAIVNTASVGGIRGVGNQAGYAASKHGVVGLTRNAGVEYGQFGIRINAVAPGAIMTPMVEGALRQIGGDDWEAVGREYVSVNPMKRLGRPEEVAYVVAFLLSDQASFINATVIPIDGGQSYKY
ncbi:SDR family oxidoreductase [Aromatoleum toluolicum]|uniref:SDR family oxidoreductase n=1 Tax=Aromatoleum toluolicum TaxID=90060 RepID=A0ABX1NAW0_9RHOO|nr:glucose 1-dehydrogenase [Aromatoleum toluolicum]NMF96370.1 SDR family oxidoreductase [Aromatoleum toluolicum]